QEDMDVPHKMERLKQWCDDINSIQSNVKYDYVFVDIENFEKYPPSSFKSMLQEFRKYKDTEYCYA
ncbi:MAG: hypothetical protein ACOC39_02720, partial [Desulfovermiculus sp.]